MQDPDGLEMPTPAPWNKPKVDPMTPLSESRRKEIEWKAGNKYAFESEANCIKQAAYKEGATHYASLLEEKERECERLKNEVKDLKEEELKPGNRDINYDLLNPKFDR